MKNKRGLTLVELIVSIALISMIMVFLMKILNEIKHQEITSNTKVEYKNAVNILTKSTESMIIGERPVRNGLNTCDDSDMCYVLTFESENYLKLFISNDKKMINIFKYNSNDEILNQEIRSTPEKEDDNYLGKYDDLNYDNSVLFPTDLAYNYENDSLLTLTFNIYDQNNQTYPVNIYIACENVYKQIYTVKYNCNGGSTPPSNSNHVYGVNSNLRQNTCTYVLSYANAANGKGMIARFLGWSTTASGSVQYTDGQLVSDLATSGQVTLYAVWQNIFSYSGSFKVENDGGGLWRIKFLGDGNFVPAIAMTIDAFLVGGGGAGCGLSYDNSGSYGGGGGGGGYTSTYYGIPLTAGTSYPIDIGAGGTPSSSCSKTEAAGKTTSGFGKSRPGGEGGNVWAEDGGDGGSGGGGGYGYAGVGGKNGGAGRSLWGYGGVGNFAEAAGSGQGKTTCEFDQGVLDAASCRTAQITMYAGGGGGRNAAGGTGGGGWNSIHAYSAMPNTGGGGGGTNTYNGGTGPGNGGSGIIVIRLH